jgi:hypothetical protein
MVLYTRGTPTRDPELLHGCWVMVGNLGWFMPFEVTRRHSIPKKGLANFGAVRERTDEGVAAR